MWQITTKVAHVTIGTHGNAIMLKEGLSLAFVAFLFCRLGVSVISSEPRSYLARTIQTPCIMHEVDA